MIAATNQLQTNDIKYLLNSVPKYPVSVKKIIHIASRNKLSSEVINFYRAFPDSAVFEDEDDMVARTEQVELLRSEQQPNEDVVRGAED